MASNTQDKKNRISLSINAFLSGLIDQQLRKKRIHKKLKEVNFFIFLLSCYHYLSKRSAFRNFQIYQNDLELSGKTFSNMLNNRKFHCNDSYSFYSNR